MDVTTAPQLPGGIGVLLAHMRHIKSVISRPLIRYGKILNSDALVTRFFEHSAKHKTASKAETSSR
eukprot:4987554-Pyramimonas_sp.AAC.2